MEYAVLEITPQRPDGVEIALEESESAAVTMACNACRMYLDDVDNGMLGAVVSWHNGAFRIEVPDMSVAFQIVPVQ